MGVKALQEELCRVGQTVYIRYFLQGYHQIYGRIRRIYTRF